MDVRERHARAASFGPGAGAYERGRPTYPDAAVDWLLPAGARRVLDLGAGTGKLTRSLAARGLDTVAVDPSPAMLEHLAVALPSVEARVGAAEAIPLPDASVDAVLVAQAWHWFDAVAASREAARVLRPGGTLGLVWNTRDTSVEWVARLDRVLDGGREPAGHAGEPVVGAPFAGVEGHVVRWSYPVDAATLADIAASRSAFLTMPEDHRRAVLDAVDALFEEVASASHGDPARRTVAVPYLTRCFRARPGGDAASG